MKNSWILFTARRYLRKNKQSGHSRAAGVFSVLGIATGVFALVVIIAVMNGYQLGFIENILEISSYHIRVDNFPAADAKAADAVKNIKGVKCVIPFLETNGIVRAPESGAMPAIVRGLPPGVMGEDAGFAAHVKITAGAFDLSRRGNVVVGVELARRLGVKPGGVISFLSIEGLMPSTAKNEDSNFTVTGLFRSGYYDYDSGLMFMNVDDVARLNGGAASSASGEAASTVSGGTASAVSLGIKIKNRFDDAVYKAKVEKALTAAGLPPSASMPVTGWRDYNKSFFSALRTEKLFMFILVGLIFIVVGVNIYQSQRRLALEKREEIGLLRALGAQALSVRGVFLCNGLYIGFLGAASGLILGLLVALHIGAFFTGVEAVVNAVIDVINDIAGIGGRGDFAIFSPAVFYLKGIPSRVIPHEAALIFLFGFLSAAVSSFLASRKAAKIKPAEVLRNE